MGKQARVALFCEDQHHELFVRELIHRLASEVGLEPLLQALNTRGGHGRAITEFKIWQDEFSGFSTSIRPDLLVLVIDANCTGWNQAHKDTVDAVDSGRIPHAVVGCPDPHVERWFLADPVSFKQVVGASPDPDPGKCDRGVYKKILADAFTSASLPVLTGPAELAPDLVDAMDLYKAGKSCPSLGHFVDDLRKGFRFLAG